MSAADDLALVLDSIGGLEEGQPGPDGFVVDNLDKATWAVARIARHRQRLAEAENTAAEWRARIDAYLDAERQRCAGATEYLEGLLRRYHEQRITEDNPGAASWADVRQSKTVRTPAGDLVARKAPDTLAVDEGVFVPWAIGNAEGLLSPPKPRTPDKRAIKAQIGEVMADGTVVDGHTGQFIPGVVLHEGDVTYTVKTPEVGR